MLNDVFENVHGRSFEFVWLILKECELRELEKKISVFLEMRKEKGFDAFKTNTV